VLSAINGSKNGSKFGRGEPFAVLLKRRTPVISRFTIAGCQEITRLVAEKSLGSKCGLPELLSSLSFSFLVLSHPGSLR
jgi:hypothetical protein